MSVHRALRHTTLSTIINFTLAFISVVIVSRLLSPEEIGIFSVAVSLIAYTHILRDFGVGQYIIQLKEVSREQLRAGFTVMLLTSWSIAALLLIIRSAATDFYSHAGIGEIFSVLAINFIILPFGSPILSVLKREMQFGKVAIVSMANSSVQVSATIFSALIGESYMSMAWGSIAGNLTNVILLSLMRKEYALLTPSFKNIGSVFSFGSKASGGSLISELGTSGPDLVLGKTLGFDAVGSFSRAASLNNMLLGKVNEIVSQVFFPAFAQGIRQGRSPATMYYDSMRVVTGITVPLIAALAFFSEPLILFLFGQQWKEAAYLATYLCAYQLIRAPVSFARNALMAGGHAGAVLKSEAVIQIFSISILFLSIWIDLEKVVQLLIVPHIISLILFSSQLSKYYAVKRSTLASAIFPSYQLIIPTIAGPLVLSLLGSHGLIETSTSFLLFIGGWLSALGYTAALHYSEHPAKKEIAKIFSRQPHQ